MSAYDKPVSKLAESPELFTGLESLTGSKQQQAQSVILGLKNVSHDNWGSEKPKKCPGWDRKAGRKQGRGKTGTVSSIVKGKSHILQAGQKR